MINKMFKVQIGYSHIDEKGNEKKTSEHYLVDALAYTEAEARTYKKAEEFLHGEFSINKISPFKVGDVFFFDDGEYWFEMTVAYLDIDEKSGKEKKITSRMLIEANSNLQANQRILEKLENMAVPFDVIASKKSNILEVFMYDPEEGSKEMEEKLKKDDE